MAQIHHHPHQPAEAYYINPSANVNKDMTSSSNVNVEQLIPSEVTTINVNQEESSEEIQRSF